MPAQRLDVGDKVACRVVGQLAQRGGAAGAALVEYDDAVVRGIEEPAVRRRGARARAAVQEQRRQAVALAGLLPIERVAAVDAEPARLVGLDIGVEIALDDGSLASTAGPGPEQCGKGGTDGGYKSKPRGPCKASRTGRARRHTAAHAAAASCCFSACRLPWRDGPACPTARRRANGQAIEVVDGGWLDDGRQVRLVGCGARLPPTGPASRPGRLPTRQRRRWSAWRSADAGALYGGREIDRHRRAGAFTDAETGRWVQARWRRAARVYA
jgi:hypothetical protein